MATSRKDKTRKTNLENYKKSKKKSMANAPEMRPFRQVPTWQATEKFEIEGSELEALYNYFNIVAPAFTAIQQVFARGIQTEKIKVGYEYEDGTQVPDEEVAAYTEKLNAYFKEKMSKETVVSETSSPEEQNSQAVVLDMNGVPATSQS